MYTRPIYTGEKYLDASGSNARKETTCPPASASKSIPKYTCFYGFGVTWEGWSTLQRFACLRSSPQCGKRHLQLFLHSWAHTHSRFVHGPSQPIAVRGAEDRGGPGGYPRTPKCTGLSPPLAAAASSPGAEHPPSHCSVPICSSRDEFSFNPFSPWHVPA